MKRKAQHGHCKRKKIKITAEEEEVLQCPFGCGSCKEIIRTECGCYEGCKECLKPHDDDIDFAGKCGDCQKYFCSNCRCEEEFCYSEEISFCEGCNSAKGREFDVCKNCHNYNCLNCLEDYCKECDAKFCERCIGEIMDPCECEKCFERICLPCQENNPTCSECGQFFFGTPSWENSKIVESFSV
jgi:hypothetical protein